MLFANNFLIVLARGRTISDNIFYQKDHDPPLLVLQIQKKANEKLTNSKFYSYNKTHLNSYFKINTYFFKNFLTK